MVEHWLPKPRVVGSNPIFRSIFGVRNVAQLVAHYVRDVGVGRSSRLIPTQGDKRAFSFVAFSFSFL